MSRTKRRTSGETSYHIGNIYKPHETTDHVRIDTGIWLYHVKVILSKKETAKKLAKYHSDCGNGSYTNKCKWGRNENSFRSHCKQEIVKFNQQEDYPVQLQVKRFLRGWWN